MSANIFYRPLKKAYPLQIMSPSSFITSMEMAFGNFPVKLSKDNDMKICQGMASVDKSFECLIAALEKHEVIEVYSES